jgi:hypothetical protein
LLEQNGIRAIISPNPSSKEIRKPDYGIAVCAAGGIDNEKAELLKIVGLSCWFCTYSFMQDEVKYSGYIISMRGMWNTEDGARAFLEQAIEVADE